MISKFYKNVLKSVETRHGAMLAIGYLVGQVLRKQKDGAGLGTSLLQSLNEKIQSSVTCIGKYRRQASLFMNDSGTKEYMHSEK